MAELAQQSATGTYSNLQRSPLQSEFSALGQEVERIATITQFNGFSLLSGGANIVLQVGLEGTSTSQINIQGIQGTLQSFALANSGSSTLSYSISAATALDSQTAAKTALDAVLGAIQEVNLRRSTLGAAESRLSSAVQTLSVARENMAAANSRISDADVAQETANLLRNQILQQSQIAIIAQANLQPQLALKLLIP